MTRLDCSVVNCTYNKDDSCCKDNIHVGGKNANVVDETSCESFRERKYDGASNADSIPSKPTEISCDAESCCYNHACKCAADQVRVSGSNACSCKNTECTTFDCKC